MYLLDTNICSYLMRGRYASLNSKLLSLHPDEVAISAITVFELEYGAAKNRWGEKNIQNMRVFLAPFQVIPFTEDDAIICGQIRADLVQKGTPIGAYDVQIAAQGLARGITIVTHNVSEFARVPGLHVIDWVEE